MNGDLWSESSLWLEGNVKHDSHLLQQESLFSLYLFCFILAWMLVKVSFFLYAVLWAGAVEVQTYTNLAIGTAISGCNVVPNS